MKLAGCSFPSSPVPPPALVSVSLGEVCSRDIPPAPSVLWDRVGTPSPRRQDADFRTRKVSEPVLLSLCAGLVDHRLWLQLWSDVYRRDVQHHAVRGHGHSDVHVLQHVQRVSVNVVVHSLGRVC